jgi:hypothetical protein
MELSTKLVGQKIGEAIRETSENYLKASGILMLIGMVIGWIFGFGSKEEPEKEEE